MPRITADTDLAEILALPGVMAYFIARGVSPFSCAGAFPRGLGALLAIKKVPDPAGFMAGLQRLLDDPPEA